MSSLQSGPYQSKVFSYVMRHTRQWIDQGKIALRRLRITGSWTTQILLYPIYIGFQAIRLAGAQLRQAIELGLPGLNPVRKDVAPIPAPSPTVSLTADTPVQQALLTIQNFSLPITLPVQLEQHSLVVQSVRGVASHLKTRSLVLVTTQNQILDLLTPQQQEQLAQRIEWEIGRYERYQHFHQIVRGAIIRLRPLVEESRKLPPVHALQQFLTNRLQTEPIQQMGLRLRQFAEWSLPKLRSLGTVGLALDTAMRDRWLPETPVLLPTADIQVRQILRTVQRFSAFTNTLVLQNSPHSLTSSPPHLPTPHSPTAFVQGIATVLETQSLVLVTNQNQILDVLTTEQQHTLWQRIIWEVAKYGRYQRMRQSSRQVFSRLNSTPENTHVLSPVRAFRQLMAWVQASPIAIATNLFQESSLFPVIEAQSELPMLTGGFSIRLLFSRISSVPLLSLAVKPPSSPFSAQNSLPRSPSTATEASLSLPFHSPNLFPVSWTATSTFIDSFSPPSDSSVLSSVEDRSGLLDESWSFIETSATPVGYVFSPQEIVLRRLDQILAEVERGLASFWKEVQTSNGFFSQLRTRLTAIWENLHRSIYQLTKGFLRLKNGLIAFWNRS